MTFEEAVKKALENDGALPSIPPRYAGFDDKNTVRSVQRLMTPFGKGADWIARRYTKWLPRFFKWTIRVDVDEKKNCKFRPFFMKRALLELTYVPERSRSNRQLFYVTGGLLAKRLDHGWLEFRQVLGGQYTIAAIHEFVPRLPWFFLCSNSGSYTFICYE